MQPELMMRRYIRGYVCLSCRIMYCFLDRVGECPACGAEQSRSIIVSRSSEDDGTEAYDLRTLFSSFPEHS